MDKILICVILMLTLSMLFSCNSMDDHTSNNQKNIPQNGKTDSSETAENFILKATVVGISDRIDVEIIESDYAFGIYWVITAEHTIFLDKNGNAVTKHDLKPGDTVEIVYGGQVMMSYPPQIVASKITVI